MRIQGATAVLCGLLLVPAGPARASDDPAVAARAQAWNAVFPFDPPVLRAINQNLASGPLDVSMSVLSNRIFLVGVPFAALPYTYATRGMAGALETAGSIAVAEGLAGGLGLGLKLVFQRPRAYLVDPTLRTPDGPEDTAAFPSNHAAVAFAWATVLAGDEPVLAVPAYALATGGAFSRMYMGVHYPADVLAGALLGAATGAAVLRGRQELRRRGVLPASPATAPAALTITF